MYFFFSMRLLNNCVAVFLVFLLVYLLDFGTSCGTEHFGTFCCAKIDFCIKCIFASNTFLHRKTWFYKKFCFSFTKIENIKNRKLQKIAFALFEKT